MGSLFWGTRSKKIDFSQCLSEVADSWVSEGRGAWVQADRNQEQQQEFGWHWPSVLRCSADNQQTTLPEYLLTFIWAQFPLLFFKKEQFDPLRYFVKRQRCPVKVTDVFWAWLMSRTLGFSFWVACRLASITVPFWNDFEGYCWFQGTHCLPKPCSRKRDGREAERYNLRDWEIRQT